MYTLLSQIYASYNRKEEYSVLILGLDDAGKTTLLERMKSQNGVQSLSSDKITPTIGQNRKFMYKNSRFQIWDLGGQSSLRGLWTNYYASTHLILFVIDASSSARLAESCTVFATVSETAGAQLDIPILLVANKQDADGAMSVESVKASMRELIEAAGPKEGGVLGCSALTGTGVPELMEWIESRVQRNKVDRPPVVR